MLVIRIKVVCCFFFNHLNSSKYFVYERDSVTILFQRSLPSFWEKHKIVVKLSRKPLNVALLALGQQTAFSYFREATRWCAPQGGVDWRSVCVCVCVWSEREERESARTPGWRRHRQNGAWCAARQHGFVSREKRPAVCRLDGKFTAEHAYNSPHQPGHSR